MTLPFARFVPAFVDIPPSMSYYYYCCYHMYHYHYFCYYHCYYYYYYFFLILLLLQISGQHFSDEAYFPQPAHFIPHTTWNKLITNLHWVDRAKLCDLKSGSSFFFFFFIWVFFQEHIGSQDSTGKWGLSLLFLSTNFTRFKGTDISRTITTEKYLPYIASSRTQTRNNRFPSANR